MYVATDKGKFVCTSVGQTGSGCRVVAIRLQPRLVAGCPELSALVSIAVSGSSNESQTPICYFDMFVGRPEIPDQPVMATSRGLPCGYRNA